ncbi:hypothetical protein FACS1894171_1470 [Clostridia bacterium]|nr:hypothetical protein FACS1894171_1470 [Clostridia bacterium]
MKKIYVPMIRYGDKEFDEGYIGWGFNSYDEQIHDARGVLNVVGGKNMKILDIACGLAIYHKVWVDAGHTVVGTDLSDTFIFMANNNNDSPNTSYRVENYYDLAEENEYDLVTLIDTPVEDEELPGNVFRALKPGGNFVFQIANPLYEHVRGPININYRNWCEKDDQTFVLTRHEYNDEIDRWEYEEWSIDVENAEILVQHHFARNLSFKGVTDILKKTGFSTVAFFDHEGRPFDQGEEKPRAYFVMAHRSCD